jgi:hypothetical protein
MSFCTNCKARLTCGCQKRVSNKGVAGCANCIGQLNGKTPPPQKIQPKTVKAPTNVTGVYKGPGSQI